MAVSFQPMNQAAEVLLLQNEEPVVEVWDQMNQAAVAASLRLVLEV